MSERKRVGQNPDPGSIRLKLLIEFDVFAKHTNVSRAAKELGISQATLSRHIFDLEERLGFYLVNRGSRLTLTLAGRVFAENMSGALGDINDVIASCRDLQERNEQVLRIEEISQICAGYERFYSALAKFFAASPYARYEMVPLREANTKEALDHGIVDVCFWYDFGSVEDLQAKRSGEGLGLVHLADDSLVVWLDKDHPLAGNGVIGTKQLLNYRVMTMVSRDSRRYSGLERKYLNYINLGFNQQHFDSRIVHSFTEFLMLDPGASVYVLPKSLMRDKFIEMRENMVFCDLDPERSHHSVFLAYKKDNANPLLKNFLDLFR